MTDVLRWQLRIGDKLEWLHDLAEETGKVPQALLDQPEIPEHLAWVWAAYHEVATDRPTGFSVGRIPFTSCDRYAERFGINGRDEFDRFLRLIRAMDDVVVEHWRNEEKRREKERARKP